MSDTSRYAPISDDDHHMRTVLRDSPYTHLYNAVDDIIRAKGALALAQHDLATAIKLLDTTDADISQLCDLLITQYL